MAKSSFKDLKNRTDDVYKRYEAHFGGKPRASRDLELLDELLGELDDIIDDGEVKLNGSRDPAIVSLIDTARQRRSTYRDERKAIVEAKEQAPQSEAGGTLAREANLIFGRYYRHFANKDRRTRDLGLLTEIIVELEGVQKKMESLDEDDGMESNLETVENNLELYRNEYRAIEEARENVEAGEQPDVLAALANDQFAIYRNHFAGKSRSTRRPGLLERVINQLKQIHKKMYAISQGGLASQANERNMEIVSKNLDVYQTEVDKIHEAKASVTTEQLAGSLGATANEIMAEYRESFAGENRKTRDLEQLSLICDRMGEIASQMRAIQRDEPSEMNAKNLNIVLESWTLYESEYRKVEKAQSEG